MLEHGEHKTVGYWDLSAAALERVGLLSACQIQVNKNTCQVPTYLITTGQSVDCYKELHGDNEYI